MRLLRGSRQPSRANCGHAVAIGALQEIRRCRLHLVAPLEVSGAPLATGVAVVGGGWDAQGAGWVVADEG